MQPPAAPAGNQRGRPCNNARGAAEADVMACGCWAWSGVLLRSGCWRTRPGPLPPRRWRPSAPATPGDSEVGAEFAGVFQPGGAVVLGEGELLRHVRDQAAHQVEGDPAGPVEGDRLQRDGGQPAAVDRV
jgi:hypothetical protein